MCLKSKNVGVEFITDSPALSSSSCFTEKGTGGLLARWQREKVVTSPATMWLPQTPSKQKSTLDFLCFSFLYQFSLYIYYYFQWNSCCHCCPSNLVQVYMCAYIQSWVLKLMDGVLMHVSPWGVLQQLSRSFPLITLFLWQVVFREDYSAWLREAPSEPAEQTRNLPGAGQRDHKRWERTDVERRTHQLMHTTLQGKNLSRGPPYCSICWEETVKKTQSKKYPVKL